MTTTFGADELVRLNSWALSIASTLTGFDPVPEGDGYRFRNKGSLKVKPDCSFFDFEVWRGDTDALRLIMHLLECDRPKAIDWALEFLSTNQGAGALDDDGAEATWENEDIDTIRMQTIWGASGSIEGTAGLDYLQKERGIDWSKLTQAERQLFRWIDNARGDEGAVVVAVNDRKGELVAIQLTYVTRAGRKSPHKVPRRTYRGRGDWRKHGFVQFDSGTGDTAYLTEGVEDALSLRMAGYERVFASLGVGGIGHAPLPPSIHHTVVVRDNDEPWSQGDKALTRGLVRLFGQGLGVSVTPRPPELFPSDIDQLKDANDVLRAHGIDGVRELVKRASLDLGRIDPDPVLDELSRLDEAALSSGRRGVGRLLRMTQQDLQRALSARRRQRAAECEGDGDEVEGHRGHVEPHPDPQDLRSILDDTMRLFNRHLCLPPGAAHYMALYAALSPLYRLFAHAPRTMFISATPDSGKSVAASLLLACCQDGERTDNITPAALFRFIEQFGGVIFVNETDWNGARGEDMQGLWNSGFEEEGRFHRTEQNADGQWVVRSYNVFSLVIFAGTKPLPSQANSRTTTINMEPALPPPLGPDIYDITPEVIAEAKMLASRYVRWAQDRGDEISEALRQAYKLRAAKSPQDPVPASLRNRAADKWRPFFILAQLAGDPWPEYILQAQRALHPIKTVDDLGELEQLLFAIKRIFAANPKPKWRAQEIHADLIADTSAIWAEMPDTGKQITVRRICALLRRAGIVRRYASTGRGSEKARERVFLRESFDRAFARWVDNAAIEDEEFEAEPGEHDQSHEEAGEAWVGPDGGDNDQQSQQTSPQAGTPDPDICAPVFDEQYQGVKPEVEALNAGALSTSNEGSSPCDVGDNTGAHVAEGDAPSAEARKPRDRKRPPEDASPTGEVF